MRNLKLDLDLFLFSHQHTTYTHSYQLGDNKVKSPGAGGSFSSITCECAAIGQRFDDPRVRVCGCVRHSSPMWLNESWTTSFHSIHLNMTE